MSNAEGYPAPPTVKVARLDSRLRLHACSKPLEAFSPANGRKSGRITVGVRCTGDKPWSLYVPVTVSIMMKIVVAARDLPRNTMLARSDLKLEQHDITRLHQGFIKQPARAIGKKLKQHLQLGQALTPRQIIAPQAVKRGSRVAIIANKGSLQVRMQGKAMVSGAVGERIRVRNENSKRELEATVISPGVVEVTM